MPHRARVLLASVALNITGCGGDTETDLAGSESPAPAVMMSDDGSGTLLDPVLAPVPTPCHEYASALCSAHREQCGETSSVGFVSCEILVAESCADLYGFLGAGFDEMTLARCLTEVRASDCPKLAAKFSSARGCVARPGTLAAGTSCSRDHQCTNGHCDRGADEVCGRCSDTAVPESETPWGRVSGIESSGEPPFGEGRCKNPFLFLVDGVCQRQGGLGDPCDRGCDPILGLSCLPLEPSASDRVCSHFPVAGINEPCGGNISPIFRCDSGTVCVSQSDLGSGTCHALLGEGEACTAFHRYCEPELRCTPGNEGAAWTCERSMPRGPKRSELACGYK